MEKSASKIAARFMSGRGSLFARFRQQWREGETNRQDREAAAAAARNYHFRACRIELGASPRRSQTTWSA